MNGEKWWEINTVRQIVHVPAVDDGQVFAVGRVNDTAFLVAFSPAVVLILVAIFQVFGVRLQRREMESTNSKLLLGVCRLFSSAELA